MDLEHCGIAIICCCCCCKICLNCVKDNECAIQNKRSTDAATSRPIERQPVTSNLGQSRNQDLNNNHSISTPVVVTSTSIPVPPAGYPQNTAVPLHMSQPHPVYAPQTGYPHSPNATAPYPDTQPPVDMNPPSYDQVVRGTDVYQKPLPYNPNFAGQQ